MSIFLQGHALLIGVGADLADTVTDAQGLAKMLKDPERCAYPADQVHVLTQEQATRDDILNSLDQLVQHVNAESTVIFYFSGHGYEVDTGIGKQYFLMPYGYRTTDLIKTAISGPDFMAKIEAIKAQKILIILDCCHAGGIDNAGEKATTVKFIKAPMPADAANILTKGRGRVIISSCKEHEKSYTGEPYSQFTQALLEALTGAGLSKQDGYVRAADLALYAAKTVPQHTKGNQNPDLHFDQADNSAVAYYAAGATAPKGLPKEAQRRAASDDDELTTQSDKTTITNENSGSGGMAVGTGNRSAGEGGVIAETIYGDVMTGKQARKIQAGTYIDHQENRSVFDQRDQTIHGAQTNINGDVHTGGDFVGLDKVIHGDEVRGDKVAGDKVDGDKYNEFVQAIQPLLMTVRATPAEQLNQAIQKAEALQAEVAKGKQAHDEILAELIDELSTLAPNTTSIIKTVFSASLLSNLVGPTTRYVLRHI